MSSVLISVFSLPERIMSISDYSSIMGSGILLTNRMNLNVKNNHRVIWFNYRLIELFDWFDLNKSNQTLETLKYH